jgi:hypothetical protein
MRVDVQCGVDERSACKHGLVVSVSRSSIRYLALADKAARTLAMLTERLDHHRGRGATTDRREARHHRQRRSGSDR